MALAILSLVGSVLAQTKPPEVVVKTYNGRPTIFVNGTPKTLPGYSPGSTKAYYDKYMPLYYAHKMGVYLIWIDGWGSSDDNRWWSGDKISDQPQGTAQAAAKAPFLLEDQVAHIMKGDPDAYLIIRFFTKAPKSWAELHPNEFAINEAGQVQDTPSLASDTFWGRAAEFSAAIVRYCEAQPWATRVIGYNTHYLEEGTHIPAADGWLFDHNPLMTKRYRDFLHAKYGEVEKLRGAWGDPTLTFETVQVPKDKLRSIVPEVSSILYWQNARDNQPLRDYLELTRDLFQRRFRQSGEAMAKAADRRILILHDALKQVMQMQGWNLRGFFNYAYGGEGVSWSLAYPELMAGSGHLEAVKLFDAVGFDGILTPHDYQARGVGGVYLPEGMADSAVLRGKAFWGEMDTRSGNQDIGTARNYREWAAITGRNFATGWTRGFDSYWMYGFFIADWFGDQEVQDVIRRQTEVMRETLDWKHETVPGIAMIIDDTAVLETSGLGNFLNEAVMWETKFDFEMIPVNAQRRILISNFHHPITRNLPADLVIGGPLPYGPVLLPKDCTELGLAWAKGGNNPIGLGLREFGKGAAQSPADIAQRGEGDYAAIFTTAVNLPADLWRNLARYAGAHVYADSNDVLLANNRVVALHSLKTERKRIALPGEFAVKDLVTGKPFSPGTNEIGFELIGPETRVFLLEKK